MLLNAIEFGLTFSSEEGTKRFLILYEVEFLTVNRMVNFVVEAEVRKHRRKVFKDIIDTRSQFNSRLRLKMKPYKQVPFLYKTLDN